jgi:epoxyqueuosine reductase
LPPKKDLATTGQKIKDFATENGADIIGFTPAEFDAEGEKKLQKFIAEGRNADMKYLENFSDRVNPQKLLPGAKSIIVIGVNYFRPDAKLPAGHGRVARYARGRDYHKILHGILKKIERFIALVAPEEKSKICVDSSPILEKPYAVKAGLGFIGKNTTLINPKFGSFLVLGELITTLKLDYDKPVVGTCGTCTRCLDACPTKALIAAGQMDARRCISYLTIENKGAIPKKFHEAIGARIFGCDTCQEACPYNQTLAHPATHPDFTKQIAGESLPIKEIAAIRTDAQYLARFAGSPLMRTKRKGLQRNAEIVAANAGE